MTTALFTYRCFESDESSDAHLWHRTGQRVTILRELHAPEVDEDEIGGCMYEIRFADGLVGTAWHDEIVYG